MPKVNSSLNDKVLDNIRLYKKKYLLKKYENLDESATRLMINFFLTDVLGYTQIDEIKTEYAIKGTYADYVIQLQKKKHFVVEVKSFAIDLSSDHLRQALNYAANEGIPWVMLTNGRQFELYAVIFAKPISFKLVFSLNLLDASQIKKDAEFISLLHKKSVISKHLDKYWAKFLCLDSSNIAKLLYSPEVLNTLKRKLRAKTGISFSDEDLVDAIHKVIVLSIPSNKPRSVTPISKKEGKLITKDSIN